MKEPFEKQVEETNKQKQAEKEQAEKIQAEMRRNLTDFRAENGINPTEKRSDLNSDKEQVEYKVIPLPLAKKDNEKKKEEEKKPTDASKPTESACICMIIKLDKDGNVLAYSIGKNGFSDQFHDISHMGKKKDDFLNDIQGIMKDTFHKEEGALSLDKAVNAVKEKFPGSRTYTDTAAKSRADEWLAKQDHSNNSIKKSSEDKEQKKDNIEVQDEQQKMRL